MEQAGREGGAGERGVRGLGGNGEGRRGPEGLGDGSAGALRLRA